MENISFKQIKNRILRTGQVPWRTIEWFQPPGLKQITKEKFAKLKASIVENDFLQPFNVWDEDGKIWILDGHHRKRAMEALEQEGYTIPETLPANFIDCRTRREAAKLVIVYSAIYADITKQGLADFITTEGLDLEDLKMTVDLPQFDFGNMGMENDKDGPEETEELKPYQRTHVLLSFPPRLLITLQPLLQQIISTEGVEYEQGSN
jgi:hypothetical protein